MKRSCYYMLSAILLGVVSALTSCTSGDFQNEEIFDDIETIEATSDIADLIRRTVDNDGSFDNIVDGSSCFDIRFPYTVLANGTELTIAKMEDLELIENIFDALETDEDNLEIIFPITVTMADYTELTLNNDFDFQALADDCIAGKDEDIECIDFIYPITVFTFDPNLVRNETVILTDDSQSRRFFVGLGEADLLSFDFPIFFERLDGTSITVTSNTGLREAIEGVMDSCDEDDDNDFNDDDFTQDSLNALLIECSWLVQDVERNGQDFSNTYINYTMDFNEDGSAVAHDPEGNILNGQWSTRVSDFSLRLNLEFESTADFTQEWFLDDIGGGRVKLFVGDNDKVIISISCEATNEPCSEDLISSVLDTCRWLPSQTGESFLDSLYIDFSNRNIHAFDNDDVFEDEGNWEISGNLITFNNLSATLTEYNGSWEVSSCSDLRLTLKRGEETLNLIKDCEQEEVACTEAFISENISICQWAPSQGENSFLDDLSIDFSRMAIHVRDSSGTVVDEGNWSISGNVLTFNNLSMTLDNYIGEWTVTECSASRFVLERGEDPLVIEKECE